MKLDIIRYILPVLIFLGSCKNVPLNERPSEKPKIVIVITDDWKRFNYYEYDRYEQFNLKDDFSEQLDLSTMKPEIASKLLTELTTWTDDVQALIPSIPIK
jgi:hypothetical protein